MPRHWLDAPRAKSEICSRPQRLGLSFCAAQSGRADDGTCFAAPGATLDEPAKPLEVGKRMLIAWHEGVSGLRDKASSHGLRRRTC